MSRTIVNVSNENTSVMCDIVGYNGRIVGVSTNQRQKIPDNSESKDRLIGHAR